MSAHGGTKARRKENINAMMYKAFKQATPGMLCRECINQRYGSRLKRNDCRYGIYLSYCECCGQLKNIVTDIKLFSRWKIWKLKKPTVNVVLSDEEDEQ